ncbi:hypothetical protein ACFC08_33705 [Streptomyces sp. NPDC056112]|uniref:hypothetical protein n=1 Tax=Streptomyces sp. NPDC056112 TaxID=3345715 RepID=UPI0035DD29AB
MTKKWARAALFHPAFTGVSRQHLGYLIEELAKPWSVASAALADRPQTRLGLVAAASCAEALTAAERSPAGASSPETVRHDMR